MRLSVRSAIWPSVLAVTAAGLAILACSLPSGAGARDLAEADVTISAGREGGSYYAIATRLRTQLTVDHGSLVKVRASRGSLENLSRLDDPKSPVNVGLAQTDAVHYYLADHPGRWARGRKRSRCTDRRAQFRPSTSTAGSYLGPRPFGPRAGSR